MLTQPPASRVKNHAKKLLCIATAGISVLAFVPFAPAGQEGAYPTPANPPAVSPDTPPNTPMNQAAPNPSNADQMAQPPHLPDGFVEKDEDAVSGVKSTLVGLTQRAVTKDSYDSFFRSFLSELAKRDKERAQEFKGINQNQLNSTITQIQNQWRSKYGQDFDVSDKNLIFNEQFPIAQGEVSDPNAAAINWPTPALAGQAVQASANSEQQQCNTKELTQGRAVAIIGFPAGDGMTRMNVSLIHHAITGWYVDVPADRTGEQIYNDLSSHLNYIAAHQDQWPADVTDGYRMVAHHVAAALYGVPTPGGTASVQ
jgi:hypothetical protein